MICLARMEFQKLQTYDLRIHFSHCALIMFGVFENTSYYPSYRNFAYCITASLCLICTFQTISPMNIPKHTECVQCD